MRILNPFVFSRLVDILANTPPVGQAVRGFGRACHATNLALSSDFLSISVLQTYFIIISLLFLVRVAVNKAEEMCTFQGKKYFHT